MTDFATAEDLRSHYKGIRNRLAPERRVFVKRPPHPGVIRYKVPIGPTMPVLEARRRASRLAAQAIAAAKDLVKADKFLAQMETIEKRLSSASIASRIIAEICLEYRITEAEFTGRQRSTNLVKARQKACYLLKKETVWSLERIGRAIGGRDHTTVLHGYRKHALDNGLPL